MPVCSEVMAAESMTCRGKESGTMLQQTNQRGIDIKFFGALFVLVGLLDLIII